MRRIAHDLRNPISGILAASQYLIEDAGPLLDEHHLTVLQSIEASGTRLLRLIDQLPYASPSSPRAKNGRKLVRGASA